MANHSAAPAIGRHRAEPKPRRWKVLLARLAIMYRTR